MEIATARSFILNRGIVNAPGSRGVADIVSVTMPLLNIKDLAVAFSTRAGPAEEDPLLYKLGLKPVNVCFQGREWSS